MSDDDDTVQKLPSREVLKSLVLLAEATKKKTSAAAGELGERIKNQVEDGNLDAYAFRIVAGLHRQEELKRRSRIANLRAYLDLCEEILWDNGHVGDLADLAQQQAEEEAEAKADADAAHVAKNVKALERGITELTDDEAAFEAGVPVVSDGNPDKADLKTPADLPKKRSPKVVGFPGSEGKALN